MVLSCCSKVLRAEEDVVRIISLVSLSLYSTLVPEDKALRSSEISSLVRFLSVSFSSLISADSSLGTFNAKLVDKYQDGEFTVTTKDIAGFESTENYQIKASKVSEVPPNCGFQMHLVTEETALSIGC